MAGTLPTMTAPRSLPIGLKPYAAKMSPGSAFGVVRKVNGKDTSPHNGCDFPTPVGIPLEATITGRVSLVGGSMTHAWGYYVHIICNCPLKHVVEYHILRDKPTLRIGDPVTLGQIIGHTGRSGSLFGKGYAPHHHHGTSTGGVYYNPLTIGWPSAAGAGATIIETSPTTPDEKDMTVRYFYAPKRGGMTTTEVGGPYIPANTEEAVALSLAYDGIDVTDRQWDVLKQAALNRQAAHLKAIASAAPSAASVAQAVWATMIDRGLDSVDAKQELADGKTVALRIEKALAEAGAIEATDLDLVAIAQAVRAEFANNPLK